MASEAGRRSVLLTLVSNVASNYLVLRGLDRQLDIARETEKAYAESLRIFNYVINTALFHRLKSARSNPNMSLPARLFPSWKQLIAQQEHLIAVLLGQNPEPIIRGSSIEQLTIPGIPAELPSELLEQRPDIIEAEQALIAANARIGVAEALYYPNISLTGALGVSTVNSSELFDGDSNVWGIGGSAGPHLYLWKY